MGSQTFESTYRNISGISANEIYDRKKNEYI
jgi:hypothetical protein